MDTLYEFYHFEGFEWKILKPIEERSSIAKEDFNCWGVYTIPSKYSGCKFNNLALRKCMFDSQQFINCDFTEIDASDSVFINCLFLNCKFNHANFGKTSFSGCAIIQSEDHAHASNFANAGMSQSRFLSISEEQRTFIVNVKFHGLGFRHAVFNGIVMRSVVVDHTSFENALFQECDIDVLKMDNSSCRGVVFKKCKIQLFISTLEKVIGSIGGLEMLEKCKAFVLSFVGHEAITEVSDLKNLFGLHARDMTFAKDGNLFEYINVMNYLYTQSKSHYAENEKKSKLDVAILQSEIQNGFKTTERANYLYTITMRVYENISNKGEDIDLDNILYTLKLMYFLNINEYKFWNVLKLIFEGVKRSRHPDYADFLTVSQIDYYLDEVGGKIKKDTFLITILNESISWDSQEERLRFQKVIDLLFDSSDENDHKLISLHEGSVEVILDLIRPDNFLAACCLLGIRIKASSKHGVSFTFDVKMAVQTYADFLRKIIPLTKFFGPTKITQKKFDEILNMNREFLEEYLASHNVSASAERETANEQSLNKNKDRNKLSKKKSTKLGSKKKI